MVPEAPELEIVEQGGGLKTARLTFEVFAPWNAEAPSPNGTLDMIWFNRPEVCQAGAQVSICEYLTTDTTRCYLQRTNLTCAGANPAPLVQLLHRSTRMSSRCGAFEVVLRRIVSRYG